MLNFIFGAAEKINFCDVIKNPGGNLLFFFAIWFDFANTGFI